jgi:DNA-binding MarR family transcriptional regulator
MQPELLRALRMLVERLLAEVFPGETAAARMQQLGLFTLIFVLQDDGQPITSARLTTVSGLKSSQVHRQLQKLLKIGLVERTAITSPHGRGRAWQLSIKHTPETARLLEALFRGAKAGARTLKPRPKSAPKR